MHSHAEYQLFGANITHLPSLLESHFFGHISLDQLIPLLSSHPSDPQALQAAIQQFRASKRAKVEVAQIPRQPPPCGPPPSPAPPDPMSPHPQPPPPLPHSPGVPVPPPDPSNTPTSHSVTTTFPSFPHIEVPVPDPTPRSRTPRRDTDPLFPTLIPDSYPPWVQQASVTPVGAPGTTPLRPPGIAVDPTSDPFLSMDHRDIRDFNPIDPDIAKGKGKGKGKPADKGKGKGKKGQGKGQGKGKGKPKGKEERSSTPPPAIYAPPSSQRERQEITLHHTPLPLPFQWPGLSLWQVPPYFLSIISPPFAHMTRLATVASLTLPPASLLTPPIVIPTSPIPIIPARLVIVAGPA